MQYAIQHSTRISIAYMPYNIVCVVMSEFCKAYNGEKHCFHKVDREAMIVALRVFYYRTHCA